MLKFERVLLIFNPLFFLQMILLRDFQSCGARPLQPSVPMLPANGKYDAPPTLDELLLLRPAMCCVQSKLRQSALQNRHFATPLTKHESGYCARLSCCILHSITLPINQAGHSCCLGMRLAWCIHLSRTPVLQVWQILQTTSSSKVAIADPSN
jgi:hypothetical protein